MKRASQKCAVKVAVGSSLHRRGECKIRTLCIGTGPAVPHPLHAEETGGAVHLLPQEAQQDSWSYICIICECVPFDSLVKL